MSILSALTSISKPMNGSSKSNVSSMNGSGLSMGSNSVACGGCGGSGYAPSGLLAIVDVNVNINVNVAAYTSTTYSHGSCGCN